MRCASGKISVSETTDATITTHAKNVTPNNVAREVAIFKNKKLSKCFRYCTFPFICVTAPGVSNRVGVQRFLVEVLILQ